MTAEPDDETRAFLRRLFADTDVVPADVVPGTGATRDDYLRWDAAVDTVTEVTRHGDPILDADGIPAAMPAPTTERVQFGGVAVTAAELARVGLTPEDVPRLHIIDPPTRSNP